MILGRATAEGTARYRARMALPDGHWRQALGLTVSSIGMGSYLGPPTDEADRGYAESVQRATSLGSNLIDTAVNYRYQRSERALGAGLVRAISTGALKRDEIVVCTKGGFLPYENPRIANRELVQTGILDPEDVVAGCHSMAPRYLEHQLQTSLKNLGLETIDVYYIHNPETQLSEVDESEFESRLAAAFAALETAAARGLIQCYGTATWDGYRVGPGEPGHLSLAKIVAIAEKAGGASHRFRILQAPLNLAMQEAFRAPTQELSGSSIPLLKAAQALGIAVVTSAALLQARLLKGLPKELAERFPGLSTNAQRCLQFARSTPGVLAPLVGMSRVAHVEENLAVARVEPLAGLHA